MLPIIALLSGFAAATEQKQATGTERLEQLHYGQVLYQLYQGDHERSLEAIALAEVLGVPPEKQGELTLLKGGVSLAYGLTLEANALFAQIRQDKGSVDRELMLKADYWLAVANFEQGRWAAATMDSNGFEQLMRQDLLSEEQKVNLAYQQAYMQGSNGDMTFADVLDDDSLEAQYLAYNQGVELYQQGHFDDAITAFHGALATLSQVESTPWRWTWLGWLGHLGLGDMGWGPVPAESSAYEARQRERRALANQAALALGQAQMAAGDMDGALNSFANLDPDSLLSGQALLELGNVYAERGQWLDAMSLWQYLAQRDSSFVALQAQRALAYGYETLGDRVRAMAALKSAEQALMHSQRQLALLSESATPERLTPDSTEGTETDLWPREHRDLHLSMLTGDNARWLGQWQTLKGYQLALLTKLDNLEQFEHLLEEREKEHARRAAAIAHTDLNSPLLDAKMTLQRLTDELTKAPPEHLAIQMASQTQKAQMTRLARASEAHLAIQTLKPLSPDYQRRLTRLRGILRWQLDNAFVQRRWQLQRQVRQAKAEFDRAEAAHQRLQTTLGQHRGIGSGRERVQALKAKVARQLADTDLLATRVEQYLQGGIDRLLANRGAELDAQLYHTQLAVLRLQDAGPSVNRENGEPTLLVNENDVSARTLRAQEVGRDH